LRAVCWVVCGFLAGAACPVRAEDPAAAPPARKYQIDKDRAIYTFIEDDAPFRLEEKNPSEYDAYCSILLHAREFPEAELERHARRDLTFKDLYLPVRQDYRLDLVYFEGRLKRLRRFEPPRAVKEAGVNDLYEGWLFPKDESNPVCLVVSQLPPGLEPQKNLAVDEVNRWVGAAGYSFKLLQYESRQPDPKHPGRNVFRRAPVLLGHSVTPLAEATESAGNPWEDTFLPAVVAGFGGVAVVILGLTWYYRRGDRFARAAVEARRDQNPFLE